MNKVQWDKKGVAKTCKQVNTIAEALRLLGLTPRGSNYKTFHRYTEKFGIDTSHFVGFGHSNRSNLVKARLEKTKSLSDVMVRNSSYSPATLKRRLIKEKLIPYSCAICGIVTWRGISISLHLDHINGNPTDHRVENLRFLCPNCHSQTDSYCGKKNRSQRSTCECGAGKNPPSKRCRKCSDRHRKSKIDWPGQKDLELMVLKRGYESTGRCLGVSGNAIRKRLRRKLLLA